MDYRSFCVLYRIYRIYRSNLRTESSTFNFVEPGKPGGNYGEMMKEERKGLI